MSEELCTNCGKPRNLHIIDAASPHRERNYCSVTLGDNRKWQAPTEPQRSLLDAQPIKTGYEI